MHRFFDQRLVTGRKNRIVEEQKIASCLSLGLEGRFLRLCFSTMLRFAHPARYLAGPLIGCKKLLAASF